MLKELQRNAYIKDAMRQQCVLRLVDSWYQILVSTILDFQAFVEYFTKVASLFQITLMQLEI